MELKKVAVIGRSYTPATFGKSFYITDILIRQSKEKEG